MKEEFIRIIEKIPHSLARIPFTYHHDYLRTHSKKFKGQSRATIAQNHGSSELELYAIVLTAILDGNGSLTFKFISDEDVSVCRTAKEITDDVILRHEIMYD